MGIFILSHGIHWESKCRTSFVLWYLIEIVLVMKQPVVVRINVWQLARYRLCDHQPVVIDFIQAMNISSSWCDVSIIIDAVAVMLSIYGYFNFPRLALWAQVVKMIASRVTWCVMYLLKYLWAERQWRFFLRPRRCRLFVRTFGSQERVSGRRLNAQTY